MPIGGAIIGAGASLLGAGIRGAANAFSSRRANRRMIEFWNMQNEYNSPRAQMQRFQEAGLNPNLIYGDSVSGASGNAGQIGTPARADFENPLSNITAFADTSRASAQTDLLRSQNNTEFQRGILLAEQQALTSRKAARSNQEFNQSDELFKHSLDAAKLNVQNMKQELIGKQLENDFKDASLRTRVEKLFWETQNAKETNTGVALKNELLRLQKQFLNLGLDRNSPWYAKIFGNVINKLNER